MIAFTTFFVRVTRRIKIFASWEPSKWPGNTVLGTVIYTDVCEMGSYKNEKYSFKIPREPKKIPANVGGEMYAVEM